MKWDEKRCQSIIDRYVEIKGSALPILHGIQEEFGYVPREAIPLIADALNISRADAYGIVTFYHDFREHPVGRHRLKLCRAEACQAVGANGLAERVLQRLGINWGETTADGAISVEPVFCLGLCASGPAAMVDGEVHGRLDENKMMSILKASEGKER